MCFSKKNATESCKKRAGKNVFSILFTKPIPKHIVKPLRIE